MLTSNATLTDVFTYDPDLNQDGFLDMRDLGIMARATPSKLGDPNWNPLADINHDEKISQIDWAIFNRLWHFGGTWP
jgi:hypothetical protein